MPLYSERLRVGKREVASGEVRLRKVIKTETVNQPVDLRREVLVIERVPAEGSEIARNAEAAFQQGEIVIDLMEEQPVVEKEMVVTGRVIARKDTQARQETVSREIRHEDVSLDQDAEADQIRLIGQFNTADDQEAAGAPASQSQVGSARGGGEEIQAQTTPELFGVSDPSSLIGRSVSLPEIRVQSVLGDRILSVGPDQDQTFIVRTKEPLSGIQPGDQVQIRGTVRDLPNSLEDWNANDQSMQMLRDREVYIDATELQRGNQ
jgi:uncharacterized protein (TIGR02271 family)